MGMLEQLTNQDVWNEFLASKEAKAILRPEEAKDLRAFIAERRYLDIVSGMQNGQVFPLPEKRFVNKIGTTKKRVVYTFPKDENYCLKLLTHLLYKYDGAFAANLYSFRKKTGVKKAFSHLMSVPNIGEMYSYKVDIHDYFNSVNIDLCIRELALVVIDDAPLLSFLTRLLQEKRVLCDGKIIQDTHGIMAGVPTASFLANVYLRKMDRYFAEHGILYARYSDDIMVFAPTAKELAQHIQTIKGFLADYQLEINPQKEVQTAPQQAWSFLGMQYAGGKIDIAPISLQKVKARLRRKADALLRWKRKKNVLNIYAVRAFIKYLNRYFYDNPSGDEMTWSKWYFPLLTTDRSLKAIDAYALELIRYIYTEKHAKSNYNFRYDAIKELGYRPLVHAYYAARKERAAEQKQNSRRGGAMKPTPPSG